MAWHFDETNDYVTLADDAALTLPDDDWTIAGWVKLDDLTGSGTQYFLSWGTAGANPSFYALIGEASQATLANEIQGYLRSGAIAQATTTTEPMASNTDWTHIAFSRDATASLRVWVNGVNLVALGLGPGAVNIADVFYFGARSDLDSARYYGGDMAEWAKWDRALNASEMLALADGYAPSHFRNDLKWYLPMIREYVEVISNLTVTNNGSTIASHPPIIYPTSPWLWGEQGVQFIEPALYDLLSLFTPTIAVGAVTLTPGVEDLLILNTPTVAPGSVSLSPALYDLLTYTLPVVSQGELTLQPTLYDLLTLVEPTVTVGPVALLPGLYEPFSLYIPEITLEPYVLSPALYDLLTYYIPETVLEPYILAPGVTDLFTLNTPVLTVGPVTLLPPVYDLLTIPLPGLTGGADFNQILPASTTDFTVVGPATTTDFTIVPKQGTTDFTQVD